MPLSSNFLGGYGLSLLWVFLPSEEAMKHYRYAMSLAGSYVGVSSGSFGSHSSSSRYVI